MAKWTDHRKAVEETLKRQERSVYWLAKQLEKNMSRNLVYAYLRGDSGISMENEQVINKVLGIRYTDE
jgi:hypothetical protein